MYMNENKITVIIPVYNVEPFLKKCLESVINQTYKNLEILLINDGSTDDSLNICNSFAQKDERIKVVSKTNGGQSSARNVGISMMTGDFVSFIDSDDWLDMKMYEMLMHYMNLYDADVSVCQAFYCYDNKKIKAECDDGKVYQLDGYYNMLGHILPYQQPFMKFQAWNKLYKGELIKDVRFKEGQVYEEIDFERNVLKNARKAVCFNIPLYYYRVGRPGSTVSSFNEKRLVKFTDLDTCIADLVEVNEKIYVTRFIRYSLDACLEFSYLSYKFHKGCDIQKVINDKFENYETISQNYGYKLTWRQKLYKFFPKIHYRLLSFYLKYLKQ